MFKSSFWLPILLSEPYHTIQSPIQTDSAIMPSYAPIDDLTNTILIWLNFHIHKPTHLRRLLFGCDNSSDVLSSPLFYLVCLTRTNHPFLSTTVPSITCPMSFGVITCTSGGSPINPRRHSVRSDLFSESVTLVILFSGVSWSILFLCIHAAISTPRSYRISPATHLLPVFLLSVQSR